MEAIIVDAHEQTPILPAHIEVTTYVGRPRFIGILAAIVLTWLALNLMMVAAGKPPLDPPPFPWLSTIVGVVSLFIVVRLLTTQRREDELAQHREQLTLELAILSEQKTVRVPAR